MGQILIILQNAIIIASYIPYHKILISFKNLTFTYNQIGDEEIYHVNCKEIQLPKNIQILKYFMIWPADVQKAGKSGLLDYFLVCGN